MRESSQDRFTDSHRGSGFLFFSGMASHAPETRWFSELSQPSVISLIGTMDMPNFPVSVVTSRRLSNSIGKWDISGCKHLLAWFSLLESWDNPYFPHSTLSCACDIMTIDSSGKCGPWFFLVTAPTHGDGLQESGHVLFAASLVGQCHCPSYWDTAIYRAA